VRAGGRGEIVTDARQRTGNPRIWAAGDVTGGPPYLYTAAAQGSAAANALFQAEREVDYTALPRVTFTSPAVASAGLTEAELVRSGVGCDCRVLPLDAVPRAIVNRDTRSVVKLVAEGGTGRVRGVHAVADGAGNNHRRRLRHPRRDDRDRAGRYLGAVPDRVRGAAAGRPAVQP
jgi:mercuric reductase